MALTRPSARVITTSIARSARAPAIRPSPGTIRTFSASTSLQAKNRVFDPVRSPADLDTLLALHSTRTAPLITLWTATWCRSCAEISPLIRDLVEHEFAGLDKGGVGFAEVELDSPTISDLGSRYAVTSVPTLLAFHGREARQATKVAAVGDLGDRKFVIRWIEREAEAGRRGGGKDGVGKWLAGIFGS